VADTLRAQGSEWLHLRNGLELGGVDIWQAGLTRHGAIAERAVVETPEVEVEVEVEDGVGRGAVSVCVLGLFAS
jgi:hypothetical protein